MHPYATSLSAYSSPLEPYLTPHSQSSSSDMSSPYMVAPYTAEACWHSTPQQGHPVMESPLSSPEYTTARPSPVSPEQAADGMYIPRHRHEGKISLKVNARGQQSALFQCGICQEKFAKKSNRDEHERTHDHDKPRVPCTEFGCYKDFGRPADLARHKRSVRTANHLKHALGTDLIQHHRNDRHVCRYCGKGYNRSDILKR